ncbi:B2 bradykinin receptor isoform X2 [Protopterus annectens]|nr:B2 bradykinin receptor isoform X2 [Protopterus annectens]
MTYNVSEDLSTAVMDIYRATNNVTFLQNSTHGNNSSAPCYVHWDWIYTVQPIFLWLISVLGIIENVFVLCVFCLHKVRCTVAEIYFGNLAAADLILVSCLPFWAIYIANRYDWPFGLFLCRAVTAVININLYSSMCFLVLVSIDRYKALAKTMSLGRMRRPYCAKLCCFAIWVFGFLMSTPVIAFRNVERIEGYNVTACILRYPQPSNKKWEIGINSMLFVVGFLIPSIVIAYCTIHIVKELKNNSIEKRKENQNEKRAEVLLFSVLLAFFICWLPFQIINLLTVLFHAEILSGCTWDFILEKGRQIFVYLGYSNSCINPVLYVIVGKHFRKKAQQVFGDCYYRRKSRPSLAELNYSTNTLKTSLSTIQPGNVMLNKQ